MTRRWLQIKCALCEKKIISKGQRQILELIDGTNSTFEKDDRAGMFKKFQCCAWK